jgi:pimeloyl-ACP methyl ester carboxylesterase
VASEKFLVTLVGHDIGGMIVYAYLHAYPDTIEQAVIMNVVIPAVDPWSEVIRNPSS